jgi:hypothetical protein
LFLEIQPKVNGYRRQKTQAAGGEAGRLSN